jgi:hypothetical protein
MHRPSKMTMLLFQGVTLIARQQWPDCTLRAKIDKTDIDMLVLTHDMPSGQVRMCVCYGEGRLYFAHSGALGDDELAAARIGCGLDIADPDFEPKVMKFFADCYQNRANYVLVL